MKYTFIVRGKLVCSTIDLHRNHNKLLDLSKWAKDRWGTTFHLQRPLLSGQTGFLLVGSCENYLRYLIARHFIMRRFRSIYNKHNNHVFVSDSGVHKSL